MKRKDFLQKLILLAVSPFSNSWMPYFLSIKTKKRNNRIRPGDPKWPSKDTWNKLAQTLTGRLTKLDHPLRNCIENQRSSDCKNSLSQLNNPFYISDQPALTQTSGWIDSWISTPSVFAIEAHSTSDIVNGVNFARKYNLRLVVKGGGHRYQGRSSSEDSLLIWTRKMNNCELHDDFILHNSDGKTKPEPAVSIGAGALWMDVYKLVTTQGGALCSRRRMHQCGSSRFDSERRIWKFFKTIWVGSFRFIGSRSSHGRRKNTDS